MSGALFQIMPLVASISGQGDMPVTANDADVAQMMGAHTAPGAWAGLPIEKPVGIADVPIALTASATVVQDSSGQEAETDPETEAEPTAEQEAGPNRSGALNAASPPEDMEQDRDKDDVLLDGRRRPGVQAELPDPVSQTNEGAVRAPPPEAFPTDQFPVPDRWRLLTSLCPEKDRGDAASYGVFGALYNVCQPLTDPYHQNWLKGDLPIPDKYKPGFLKEDDWFFVVNAISDTVVEPRSFPTPVGVQTTQRPDSLDVFGRTDSLVLAQTFITGFALIKGETAYKPPSVEYRLTFATQVNHVDVSERRILLVEPSAPSHRTDHFVGLQEAFVDFISVRAGIQPMQADFRGFLFQDNQLGVRLFGSRDNNRIQFNLGAFWRLEKDTNSGLNSIVETPRDDYVFFANIYRQDFPVVGLTSQLSLTYNMNRERGSLKTDDNGFPVRPALLGDLRSRSYDVAYLGYAVDGRIGRINLTGQLYGAFGEDRNSFFTSRPADIRAYFGAAEASYDVDFMRFRLSGLYASGDGDPYNDVEGGFDAIFENPIFAGADTSYWIRQVIPFAGGGRAVGINGRNGVLNSLRSSKEQGQSNFNNPGTVLLGAGADFDLTPEIRLSANANHLWFADTASIQALRNEGSIPGDIGWDLSLAGIWRPNANQNLVFRLSAAVFDPGDGFSDLFTQANGDDRYYSVLLNAIVAF